MIFFTTIKLEEQIHAGPLGFTKHIYEFVEVETEGEVEATVRAWCERLGLKFSRIASIALAQQQDRQRYTWPEQVISADGCSSHTVI